MTLLRPLPRSLARLLSMLVLAAWVVQMGLLVQHSYLRSHPVTLAADLARYGHRARWKGIYYRGEKIGFSVSQTTPTQDGYELEEDGQLQLLLMGSSTVARMSTRVSVDSAFNLRAFSFALDPGTGAMRVEGKLDDLTLQLVISTPAGTSRTETRHLESPPALSLNLPRRLAAEGLTAGKKFTVQMFDPATLRNMPMSVEVEKREIILALSRPIPAFKVTTSFSGITSRSWVTDVGEVIREESPMGLVVVREERERAMGRAVPGDIQQDMIRSAAVAPEGDIRLDDPRNILRLKVRLTGAELKSPDLQGVGQSVAGDVIEILSARLLEPRPAEPGLETYRRPEPLIESDDPEIRAEALRAVGQERLPREQARKLVRHVSALLEKKPTISLPSAREVLRTRVGDCNEHTALYVAMARSLGLPSRIAVGLVYLHGAFYYHAWPEVYLAEPDSRGLWLPVDPTLGQFPADPTHIRLARGGLDSQAAILPLMGRIRLTILEAEVKPGSTPILVGRPTDGQNPAPFEWPQRGDEGAGCWSRPGEGESEGPS